MLEEIKDVMQAVERVINNSITFTGLKKLLNTVRAFVEVDLNDAFDTYIDENVDYFEEYDLYDDAVTLLSALRDVNLKDIYTTVRFEGGEGQGDSWEHVIQHVESERFMHCEGYYASYQGFDDDGCEFIEVKAVPITVIDYQAI